MHPADVTTLYRLTLENRFLTQYQFCIMVILYNSSDGRDLDEESGVKPAYKQHSLSIFTSNGHPILLDLLF